MRRIEEGYRHRFRTLLARVRPRRLEFGVALLMGRARKQSDREGLPLPAALERLYEDTRRKVERRLLVTAACTVAEPAPGRPRRFLCDGSLAGLARWLRAAGYEADCRPDSGDALLAAAVAAGQTLVTTDSRVLRRRAVARGEAAVAWLPSSEPLAAQLGMLLRDLGLELRAPLCMACGGTLVSVAKDEVLDRIPPRTRGWKDDYYDCRACGRLFWEGTHWEKIRRALQEAAPGAPA